MEFFPEATDQKSKDEINELAKKFNLHGQELRYKWEAYELSESLRTSFSASLAGFEQYLVKNSLPQAKKPKLGLAARNRNPHTPARGLATPIRQPRTPVAPHTVEIVGEAPSSPMYDQTERKVISTLNESVLFESGGPALFSCSMDLKAFEYKPMFQRLNKASLVLDAQIEEMISLVCKHHNIDERDIQAANVPSQVPVYVVGRLYNRDPERETLTSHGLVLENCMRLGSGSRVPIDVSQLSEYSFFSGKVVALLGTNPEGTLFVAQKVLEPPLPPRAFPLKTDAHSVLVAAGPYTRPTDIEFEPLLRFTAIVEETKPSCVVLLGPFIELGHQSLASSEPQALFSSKLSPILGRIAAVAKLVVVSGLDDSVSYDVAFPAPALSKSVLRLPDSCESLPCPARFELNGAHILASSLDSLHELVRGVTKRVETTPSASHIAFESILTQRRVYPAFPPRLGVNVDVPHLELANIPTLPDILVVASSSRACAQVVKGVVCVNPGKLFKASQTGCYARLFVGSGSEPLADRTRVDILSVA